MPHTESAKKALRQTEKRNVRNRIAKKGIKLQVRKFLEAVKAGSPEQKLAEFSLAVSKIDKAAARNVIHKNAASRRKSQLARRLATPAAAPKA